MSITDKVTESLKNGINLRVSDPILSTFYISFLIWNYHIFVYLFADMEAATKIAAINESIGWISVVAPALITCAVLFGFPRIAKRAYEWIESDRVQRQNIRLQSEEQLIPQQKTFREIELRLSEEIDRTNSLNSLISSKDQKIGSLQEALNRLQEQSDKVAADLKVAQKAIHDAAIQKSDESDVSEWLNQLGIDIRTNLDCKVYAQTTGKTPEEVVSTYATNARNIVDRIFQENVQSESVKVYRNNILQHLESKNYPHAIQGLEGLQTVPALSDREKLAARFALNILRNLLKYIS